MNVGGKSGSSSKEEEEEVGVGFELIFEDEGDSLSENSFGDLSFHSLVETGETLWKKGTTGRGEKDQTRQEERRERRDETKRYECKKMFRRTFAL